jgi:hypothetical protein
MDAVINQMGDEAVERMQKVVTEGHGNALERFQQLFAAGNIADENRKLWSNFITEECRYACRHDRVAAKRSAPLYAQIIRQDARKSFSCRKITRDIGIYSGLHPIPNGYGRLPVDGEDLMRRAMALPGLIETLLHAKPGRFKFLLSQGK